MTHLEIRNLLPELVGLINHCIAKKVDIFHVNYGLDRNYNLLKSACETIEKNISKELIELEDKGVKMAKKANDLEKTNILKYLSDDEKKRHVELYEAYIKDMAEENDFKPFYLNPDKCDGLKIEYVYMNTLNKFFKTSE